MLDDGIKIFIISFSLGVMGNLVFNYIAKKLGYTDRPWKYGQERPAVAYSNGIPLNIITILCLVFAWYLYEVKELIYLAASIFILFISNIIDDYGNTIEKWKIKTNTTIRLLIQIVCATIMYLGGINIGFFSSPFSNDLIYINNSVLEYIITVFWYVGMMNAINWSDGIRGQTYGISIISLIFLAFITLSLSNIYTPFGEEWRMNTVSFILMSFFIGIFFSGFLFEFPKVRSLAGDTGTGLAGIVLGTLSIMSSTKIATSVLVLGFPIFDTLLSIIRRLYLGKKIWQGDLDHLHHRLIKYGLSDKISLFVIFIVTITFGLISIYFIKWQKLIGLAILVSCMTCLWIWLGRNENKKL